MNLILFAKVLLCLLSKQLEENEIMASFVGTLDGWYKEYAIILTMKFVGPEVDKILEYKAKTMYTTLSIRFKNQCVYIEISA